MPISPDWLALIKEDVLEPERPIIDPHHHLWDFALSPDQDEGSLQNRYAGNRYLLDQLLEDIIGGGHNVVATVFIECSSMYRAGGPAHLRPVGETEFVNGTSAICASGRYGDIRACAGIVGLADLAMGDAVDEVLQAHINAGGGRFRGIRHAAGWDASPEVRNSHTHPPEGLFLDATFRQGFARLAANNLSFEAWLYHTQLADAVDLAKAFPDTAIVLNHFGGPLGVGPYDGKRDEYLPRWKADIAALAECPNVHAKLGGINMALNGFGWHNHEKPPGSEELAAATGEFYRHAIECFGPERCMFESNFPVDKTSCSYGVLWNAFKRMAADFSESEKTAMFHDTAKNFYRLDL
jgi:predicted TIM-barrel fold metal-dependent hydrolase